MQKGKKRNMKKIIITAAIIIAVLFLMEWLFIGWRYTFGPFKALGNIRLAQLPGNAQEYDFSEITPVENHPLAGKTVLFLGSSVTNGAAALGQSIPEYFAARTGCTAIKEAVDGTTLVDNGKTSYIQRMINKVDPQQQIDMLVCQLSTNDATKELPLGEIAEGKALEDFDTQTITGAMEYVIAYAEQTWGCPVVFYTNARFDSPAYADMVARLHELQEKWGIGVLDLWSDENFNSITEQQRTIYMKDEIHPYKAGYRDWWGGELERQMDEYLKNTAI